MFIPRVPLKNIGLAELIGGLFSGFVLFLMIFANRPSDFLIHLDLSRSVSLSNSYSFLYPVLYVVTSLTDSTRAERLFLVMVLLASIAIRWIVTRHILELSGLSPRRVGLVCLGLLVFMPMPDPRVALSGVTPLELEFYSGMYLGQFTPNVWHNSTTILLGPFALLAAFNTMKYSNNPSRRQMIIAGVFLFLSALAKPNYVFAAAPIIVIFGYWIFGSPGASPSIRMWRTFLVVTPSLLLVFLQFLSTIVNSDSNSSGSIAFDPLAQWRQFSDNLGLSVARSLVLPLLILFFLMLFKQPLGKDLVVAWLTIVVAALTFALFVEVAPDGSRRFHGNLSWAIVPATYILLLYSMLEWIQFTIRRTLNGIHRLANLIVWFIFLLHALSGTIYCTLIATGRMSY